MSNTREQIPINPSMLVWARETGGFTLEDLTKTFPKLPDWEAGSSYPTYGRLEELAKKYHRPIALFFFPAPPKEDSIEKSLRAVSEEEVFNLSPRMRFLFRRAKALQDKLHELLASEIDSQSKKLTWLNESQSKSLKQLTEHVRKTLGISIQEQTSWKNSDLAFKEWRSALAENGVYVFKEAFKSDNISGFCIYDNVFPIIFINNSHSKNRQVFTLFHELAHLIYKDSFLDVYGENTYALESLDPSHIEVKCNAFAGQFLLPDEAFSQYLTPQHTSENAIEKLAQLFSVSRETVLRKFLDRALIDKTYYFQLTNKWLDTFKKKKEEKESSGGDFYNSHMSYLGDAYLSLVFKKYYQGTFSQEKAAQLLNAPIRGLSTIEERLLNRGNTL